MEDIVCYYINLKKDLDRKENIEFELSKVFSKNQINRLEAVSLTSPALGCSLSHIKCLTNFINSDKKYCIIFEDDFEFEIENDKITEAITQAIEANINLFLLSYHSLVITLNLKEKNGYLCPFSNGQTTASYMVNKEFANTLLENFKLSSSNLAKGKDYSTFALDQYWKSVQTIENKVYACVPRLGKQKSFYSNIENKITDYQGSCFIAIIPEETSNYNELLEKMKDSPFQYKIFIEEREEDYNERAKLAEDWLRINKSKMDYIFITSKMDIEFDLLFNYFKICNIQMLKMVYINEHDYFKYLHKD